MYPYIYRRTVDYYASIYYHDQSVFIVLGHKSITFYLHLLSSIVKDEPIIGYCLIHSDFVSSWQWNLITSRPTSFSFFPFNNTIIMSICCQYVGERRWWKLYGRDSIDYSCGTVSLLLCEPVCRMSSGAPLYSHWLARSCDALECSGWWSPASWCSPLGEPWGSLPGGSHTVQKWRTPESLLCPSCVCSTWWNFCRCPPAGLAPWLLWWAVW